jgi:hypothetical protein
MRKMKFVQKAILFIAMVLTFASCTKVPAGYVGVKVYLLGGSKGVDGDQSWQALGNAARYAKVWAKNNNKIVIVLAQLSDEGAIRYSKAIKDHANNMFAWTYTDQNKKSGIIDIIQQKARNQEAFDFQLQVDFSTMRMFDVEQTDFPELNRSERGAKRLRRLKDGDDASNYLEDTSD